jgi:hypothetical protein
MNSDIRIQSLLDFLKEDPGDAATKYMLALEYVRSGNDREAGKWMEEVFLHHAGYLPNYYHYGKLLERTGQNGKAMAMYRLGMVKAQLQKDLHTLSELKSALENLE